MSASAVDGVRHRYYHQYQRRDQTASKRSGRRFNLLIRLPDDRLLRIKHIKDGASVSHVKKKLELLSGFCSATYALHHVDGAPVAEESEFRLGSNITDGSILRLSLTSYYDDVYHRLTQESSSSAQAVGLPAAESSAIFNMLFMASYYGKTSVCETLLSSPDVNVMHTTDYGNTCLHVTAAQDHVNTALCLCEHGADIYKKNNSGDTPLDVALQSGSFACERELRLSQWARRKAKMTTETEYATDFTSATTPDKTNPQTIPTNICGTPPKECKSDSTSVTKHDDHHKNTRNLSASTSLKCKLKRSPSAINQEMPPASREKRKQRLARSKSAPLLNLEGKNQRPCRVNSAAPTAEGLQPKQHQQQPKQHLQQQQFKLSRPQYLQYIKSSTGVVEEDYFADIFPDQEAPSEQRSFDDQMKRNEQIFRRMFKESGTAHEYSDTDSDEELAREHANKKAFKRWNKKKQVQKQKEQEKQALIPSYPNDNTRKECLGELLMIGDTSMGEVETANPESYMTAYKTYKQGARSKSAASNRSKAHNIDPITYEEWVDRNPASRPKDSSKNSARVNTIVHKRELVKKIDYQTWLHDANKRIDKQAKEQRKEEKQKKDFDGWISELKQEVDTYDYWKKSKEEQLKKERELKRRQQEQQQRQATETERRRELAKDIYKNWVINKDLARIKGEEKKLQQEKSRLKQPQHSQK